jgi:hypothetical protein
MRPCKADRDDVSTAARTALIKASRTAADARTGALSRRGTTQLKQEALTKARSPGLVKPF